MNDDFIESVIRPKRKQENTEMIARNFNGMEAVAQFNDELLEAQKVARGQNKKEKDE